MNLIVCKLCCSKVDFLKSVFFFKKVNLGCALDPGGLQKGQFQKHPVSKLLGSPQGNAKNVKDALSLRQHQKKALAGKKDWDFSPWMGSCSTFIS